MSAVGAAPSGAPDAFGGDACSGAESFALQVLGGDMAPEFNDGDIVIVEPDGALRDGCFVVVHLPAHGGWLLRQWQRDAQGRVRVRALAPQAHTPAADHALAAGDSVRGVVIQKSVPGRRRLTRRYA